MAYAYVPSRAIHHLRHRGPFGARTQNSKRAGPRQTLHYRVYDLKTVFSQIGPTFMVDRQLRFAERFLENPE